MMSMLYVAICSQTKLLLILGKVMHSNLVQTQTGPTRMGTFGPRFTHKAFLANLKYANKLIKHITRDKDPFVGLINIQKTYSHLISM